MLLHYHNHYPADPINLHHDAATQEHLLPSRAFSSHRTGPGLHSWTSYSRGPISEGSLFIQVANLARSADIIEIEDLHGTSIVKGPPLNVWRNRGVLSVDPGLFVLGAGIKARQCHAGDCGNWSQGDIVVESFKNPNLAVISSAVHTCISAIQVSKVTVGAMITVKIDGVSLGSTVAQDMDYVWIPLNLHVSLRVGSKLEVESSLLFNGVTLPSFSFSDPLKELGDFMGTALRDFCLIDLPLRECQENIHLAGGVPGSNTKLDNNGTSIEFYLPAFDYQLYLNQPLKVSTVIFSQAPFLHKCAIASLVLHQKQSQLKHLRPQKHQQTALPLALKQQLYPFPASWKMQCSSSPTKKMV